MNRLAEELMQSRTWLEKPRINDHMGKPIRDVFLNKKFIQSRTWLEKPRINDHIGNPIREVYLNKNSSPLISGLLLERQSMCTEFFQEKAPTLYSIS
jgi:hypothetical protein